MDNNTPRHYQFYNFFTKTAHKNVKDVFANAMELNSAGVVFDAVNDTIAVLHKDEDGRVRSKVLGSGGGVSGNIKLTIFTNSGKSKVSLLGEKEI